MLFNSFHASHSSLFIFSFQKKFVLVYVSFLFLFTWLNLDLIVTGRRLKHLLAQKRLSRWLLFAVKLIMYLQIENKQKRRINIIPFFFFWLWGFFHCLSGVYRKESYEYWKNIKTFCRVLQECLLKFHGCSIYKWLCISLTFSRPCICLVTWSYQISFGSISIHIWYTCLHCIKGKWYSCQIRSHAQKYFLKVQKKGTSEHVPPPRPKRKATHPYPQKAPKSGKHSQPLFYWKIFLWF